MKGREEQKILYDNKTNKVLAKCPDYVRAFSFDFNNKSATTRYNYVNAVKRFLMFLEDEYDIDINDISEMKNIKKMHINNYISSNFNGKSESYVATQVYALKYFFNFLEDNDYISNDPSVKVKAPVDHKIHQVISLTPDEVKKVIKKLQKGEVKYEYIGTHKRQIKLTGRAADLNKMKINRNVTFFMMGVTTGLRCSEMRNINIEDINFHNRTINIVEKGGFERQVYISKELVNYIKTYIKYRNKCFEDLDHSALFISIRGNRCSYDELYNIIRKATDNLDKKISPHKLRSTYATTLYEQTGDIYLVAQGLNHSNIKNTMRYAKPSDEKNRAAADLMGNIFDK